jgi:hypothetical protein
MNPPSHSERTQLAMQSIRARQSMTMADVLRSLAHTYGHAGGILAVPSEPCHVPSEHEWSTEGVLPGGSCFPED